MITLTDLTNKMKSVGKGLQRTSAFPIDKWQLWDSYNPNNGKLIFRDPSTGTEVECDSAGDLAQLVANSIIAYPGFTFSVVDTNNDNTSYKYIVNTVKQYNPTDTEINRYTDVLIATLIKTENNSNNTNSIINYSNFNIESQLYTLEYQRYYTEKNPGPYNDDFFGLFFSPSLYTKCSIPQNSTLNIGDIISKTSNYIYVYGISVYEREGVVSPAQTIFLSVFEVEDGKVPPNIGSTSSYTCIATSDNSFLFNGDPEAEEHLFTFTKTPLILNKNKNYLIAFTTTNAITPYNSHVVKNTGVLCQNSWTSTLATSLKNSNGLSFGYQNHIPELKFHAINPDIGNDFVISKTFAKNEYPNTFTKLNTFNNGVQTNTISSTIIDIISADNSNVSSVYKLEYQNNNNFGKVLNIAATSAANIIIDTYPGHGDDALSVIQWGSTQYKGKNSRASYSEPLPLSCGDNTLATAEFTKSHINSVSSVLNTIISNTSSEVTGIVNTISSFISGEVDKLSTTVINNDETLSSAIDSKIIMRIWN